MLGLVPSGVRFANGAPTDRRYSSAISQLALEHNVALCGKDFKTGSTMRMNRAGACVSSSQLGLGWLELNLIVGHRDGRSAG